VRTSVGTRVDRTGRCGNCIKELIIFAHSGLAGLIRFADSKKYPASCILDGQWLRKDLPRVLGKWRGLFCEDGRVVIRQCCAGCGDAGTRSLSALARLWQVPVTAPLSAFRAGFNPSGWKTVTPEGKVIIKGWQKCVECKKTGLAPQKKP